MRKNLRTGEFELIKVYQRSITIDFKKGVFFSNKETGKIEIVFHNENLETVLIEANGLWNYYHYHSNWSEKKREPDGICEHKAPNQAMNCYYLRKERTKERGVV